jgi:Tfp pilus assembly protein PilE
MDPNSPQGEELYRAAVGKSKADYYVPLFHRFDQPGASRVSWNWPALFVPSFWMIYRRMFGLGFGYFFLYPVALVFLLAIASAVLGETVGVLLYWVVVIGVRVLIAMFANALYHWHIRNRIDNLTVAARSHEALVQRLLGQSASAGVVVAFVCVGVVFLSGILAAIAIPAYQDYTIRSQVVEGLNLAAPVKTSVAEAYAASRTLPAELAGTGAQDSSRYITSIEVSDGVILISYGKAAHPRISGHTLSLHPSFSGDEIEWACGYAAGDTAQTDIEPRYLPTACRALQVERL